MENFLINAFLVSILLSLICGPAGCIILWNRLTFLGDSLAHASILGIILSILMKTSIFVTGSIITILILLLFMNYRSDKHRIETILFIFSYTCFSLALIINSLNSDANIDLESMLFGDILTVTNSELIITILCVILTLSWIIKNWQDILFVTINEDLAIARNIDAKLVRTKFTIIIVILILFFVKMVGALLITALMVIPAAAARFLSISPEKMVYYSIIISILSSIIGLSCSIFLDSSSGPSIIFASSMIFGILAMITKVKNAKNPSLS